MEKMLILVAVIISFIGCAVPQQIIKQPEPELPNFVVNVNSITSDTLPSGTTYIILSADKDIPTTDLQFKEFASYVNRALVSKGYVPAENPDSADIAIFLNYGIGEPKEHRYSIPFPTYGQTGTASEYSHGYINRYGSYSGTKTYIPSYSITGYSNIKGSFTTHFRYVLIDAYDLKEYFRTKKEIQVWKTTLTSTGRSGDLRLVFPVMVAASLQYIGANTCQKIEVSLHENDERVLYIKGEKALKK